MDYCQATKTSFAEVTIKSQSPDGPYRLSAEVANRLTNHALRPLEWFNLAVIHGPFEFYLHDDFYDEQGNADQPRLPVAEPERCPIPTVSECATDLSRLIDFALTRWWLRSDVCKALALHDPDALFREVKDRFASTKNEWRQHRILEIAGKILKRRAEAWIRDHVLNVSPEARIDMLWAAAECLPPTEGRHLAQEALAALPRDSLTRHCLVLSQFPGEATLEWIEEHISDPLTREWGDLAALAGVDWNRLKSWLSSGRPRSLVALNALAACAGPRSGESPLLRERVPRVLRPAPIAEIEAVLLEVVSRDPSIRVKRAVHFAIMELPRICGKLG
jgi:hypothetical protein